jgi:predicted AlkP superfamily phosphohydrolase/phosphomutase
VPKDRERGMSRRLAVIVLDATERTFLDELIAAGELPAIAGLQQRGATVPLDLPLPYRAEYAQTELLTGQPPEAVRYWSTITFDPDTYACGSVGSARRTPFYADPPDSSVIVFDVPHAVLLDDLPGLQVVGWGGHDARFQHPRVSQPAGLLAEIDARFGTDPVAGVEYKGTWHQPWYIDALADSLIEASERRAQITEWLLEREPSWSLLMVGITEIHAAGHNFSQGVDPAHLLGSHPSAPHARERFVDVYRAVDATVARIVAAIPDDTTVALVSTKGMSPSYSDLSSAVLIAELGYRLAFGRPFAHEPSHRAWRRKGCPPLWPGDDGRASARANALRAEGRLAPLKRRYRTMTPAPLRRLVDRARDLFRRPAPPAGPKASPITRLPDGSRPVLAGEINLAPIWYRHHWPAMPWFALPSFSEGHIRINLAGRERDGMVALADYERVCDEIEATLRQLRDVRTGEAVVDEVVRLRAADPLAVDGPGADLAVTWRLPSDAFEHPDAGVIGPFAMPRSGSHNGNGFLIVAGPGIDHARLDEHPSIDVAPTLLSLLGWPVPSRLAGTPIHPSA